MSQGRILPLLGPIAVLFLIAEVTAVRRALDVTAVLLCALGFLLSTLPFWALRREDPLAGARRVSLLCVFSGMALVRWASPELPSLQLDLAFALAAPAVGALAVQLASEVPDHPGVLARRRRSIGALAMLFSVFAASVAGLAAAPAFTLFGELWLVPARASWALPVWVVLAVASALALRLMRRRLGSTPEALASGAWAQLGLATALVLILVAAACAATGVAAPSSAPVRIAGALGASALALGHVAMLGARRQVQAGPNTRRVLAVVTTVLAVAFVSAPFAESFPRDPVGAGVSAALTVIAAALVYRVVVALFHRMLAPFGGRLLRAVEEAERASLDVDSFEALGEAVLPPLRRASRSLDADPLLVTLDPPRQIRVDAAGVAHVLSTEPSPAIVEHASARPGEIIVSAPLVDQVVRRPDLRPLVDALVREDALCVVPLSRDLELEGFFLVPRGRRRAALTLEEIGRLESLARIVSSQAALLCARARAQMRMSEALVAQGALETKLEAAGEEIEKLRADVRALRAGGAPASHASAVIAYSPAMRALVRRVQEVAPLDAPVLLVGRDAGALDRVSRLVHESSGRRDGPVVVGDCAAIRPERAGAMLFGESSERLKGWLRQAEGGTLVLLDLPALSIEAQAQLAEALATRRAHPADGAAAYPIDVRVIATSKVPLEPLVRGGAFDLELERRLEPLTLEVPSLRERREDIPSLVLLALDRSCRTSGREVMGIDADALEALEAHDWPGDVAELESVIERAVAKAKGPTVRLSDLPPLMPDADDHEPEDPFRGTFAEIEARVLEHALELAGGNKSEAARILGLKRTTFLDKLKRHGLFTPETKKARAGGTAA